MARRTVRHSNVVIRETISLVAKPPQVFGSLAPPKMTRPVRAEFFALPIAHSPPSPQIWNATVACSDWSSAWLLRRCSSW